MATFSNMLNNKRINMGEAIPLNTPLVIQLEPSGFCNLECNFCPCGNAESRKIMKQDVMSEEIFDEFIRQCLEFDNPIKVLRFIGIGEPLINTKIGSFVKKAKESGAFERVEITSNGILLSEELSDTFIEHGLDTLLVSLEAMTEDSYYEITRRRINIEELKNRLSYFYNKSRSTETKLYIKTISASVKEKESFLNEYGEICDYIYVENVIENWPEFNSGAEPNAIRYDNYEYKNAKKVCIQPFKLLCIAANGDVMPCSVDWKRVNALGNIQSTCLKDIWFGDGLKEIRLSLIDQNSESICKICKYSLQNQPDDIDSYIAEIRDRIKVTNSD